MKQSSAFANLLLILCLIASCASSRQAAGEGAAIPVPPIIRAEAHSQKFNLQLDFMKHHLSGLLIVRRLPGDEIRILGTTYFGPSLFDFSLKDGQFRVNSCLEPLRKKKILLLLERDFRQLFLSVKSVRRRSVTGSTEKRVTGRGPGKSVFYLTDFASGAPSRVRIRHPWLKLSIQLDKLPAKSDPPQSMF